MVFSRRGPRLTGEMALFTTVVRSGLPRVAKEIPPDSSGGVLRSYLIVLSVAIQTYLGFALFMQSLMNDLRSDPARFLLSARSLQTSILSF